MLSPTSSYMFFFGCWWKWETTHKLISINNKCFMCININKKTKGNFLLSYLQGQVIPEPGNMFEANAKLPTGILRDYGLGVFFAVLPKN